MTEPSAQRLSLLLPVATPRELFAASQVVLYVLALARVELDLLRVQGETRRVRGPGSPGAILFVACDLLWRSDEADRANRFETELRGRIRRHYTRQGIVDVRNDLQLLPLGH